MISPYIFPSSEPKTIEIRMLPNIRKDGSIGHSFREIKFMSASIDGTEDTWERFYSEDSSLNLAVSNIGPRNLRSGGLVTNNIVLFYGLLDGKVELFSLRSRVFNMIQTELTKQIGNGLSPLDPRSGIVIRLHSEVRMGLRYPDVSAEVLTDQPPISIGDTAKECCDAILKREVDMDEYLDQFLLDKHEYRSEIYNVLFGHKYLVNWKSEFREQRLKKFLNKNKKTDK